ncbi:hypothetical protein Enr13x_60270 [Stieleria neptunia]|uniref:Uncharacterized protein n=1 Tax=Stieleria neptunia TaxID=2527979 RepID=A0A518HZ45_9BACT|nr:hypothetical protein [Stieleria neptunia]QDV46123.1 hypothetical protein Enr13x_60270 [Stieleria neptunia]
MKLYQYDQAEIESEVAESAENFDPADYFAGLRLRIAIKTGVGQLIESVSEFSYDETKPELEQGLKAHDDMVTAFLERDILPDRRPFESELWQNTTTRELVQTALVYYHARLGNESAVERINQLLRDGPHHQRYACLVLLEGFELRDVPDLPEPWVESLQSLVRQRPHLLKLLASIASAKKLQQLVPSLLKARDGIDPDQANEISLEVIKVLSDKNQRLGILNELLTSLDHRELQSWFREISELHDDGEDANSNSEVIRPVLNQIFTTFSESEFREFLNSSRATNYPQFADEDHLEILRSIVATAQPSIAEDRAASRAAEAIVRLDPKRDLNLLFASKNCFNVFAKKLIGTLSEDEPETINAIAAEFLSNDQPYHKRLGRESVLLLWNECGPRGRELLVKHLSSVSLEGLQVLVWLAEEFTVQDASSLICKLGFAEMDPDELIERAQGKHRLTPGPSSVFTMMHICNRLCAFDGESGQIPPAYDFLIKTFCSATNGQLYADSIDIAPVNEDDEYSGWNISMVCNGEPCKFKVGNTGDCYDVAPVEKELHRVARKLGIKERFHLVIMESGSQCCEYFWGKKAAVTKLADRTAIPRAALTIDGMGDVRQSYVQRIHKAIDS